MPITARHVLSMTTPDNPAYENQPKHWNSSHNMTVNLVGSEVSGAFNNGGGITFGLETNGSITAAAPPGAPSPVNFSAGTTSNNLASVVFSNSNNVSFGLNGSTVTASIATTYAGTGFTTGATAGALLVGTLNTAGLSMGVPAFLTTAMASNAATLSNIRISAGTTSNLLSAFTFNNGNGITFGLDSSTVTASHNGLTSQSNQAFSAAGGSSAFQTLGFSDNVYASWTNTNGSVAITELRGSFFAVGNTTQSSSGTQNIDAISFRGEGMVSAGVSNGSIVVSGQPVAISGSNGSFTASTFTFGNLNGLSFYTSNGSIVGSYTDAGGAGAGFSGGMSNLGNTSGTSGTVASQVVFVGTNGINLSQSVNGNSATLSFARGTTHISSAENYRFINSSNFQAPGQSEYIGAPFQIDADLSADWIANMRSVSIGSTTFTGTTNNTTFSYQFAATQKFILYSKLTGASSLTIGSVNSSSYGLTWSVRVGLGAQTTQYTQTWGATYPVSGGTSTYSTSFGVSNASLNFSTTHLTAFTGAKLALSDFATSLSAGQYWVAYGHSTTQTTQHTANVSAVRMLLSYGGLNLFNSTVAPMGVATAQSHMLYPFNGSFTVAGGTNISRVAQSQFTVFASNIMMYARMGRFI